LREGPFFAKFSKKEHCTHQFSSLEERKFVKKGKKTSNSEIPYIVDGKERGRARKRGRLAEGGKGKKKVENTPTLRGGNRERRASARREIAKLEKKRRRDYKGGADFPSCTWDCKTFRGEKKTEKGEEIRTLSSGGGENSQGGCLN